VSRRLSDAHREVLHGSGIADDVIAERGYFTLERKADLAALGFTAGLQHVPTLVVPIHGVVPGEPPWFIHRPDETPIKDGRALKYIVPKGRRMALDVHPRVHVGLGARVPLFVTEGSKKVDALVSAGAEAVVGLVGVWNWRGTNHAGGKTLLPDWEWVALGDGRQVYIVFDSDVMLKPEVHEACTRLGGMLKRRGADVAYVYLPSGEGGTKVGADDFLARGRTLADVTALAARELREPLVEDDDESSPGTAVVFRDPKPWPEPVSGAELLGEVEEAVRRHVALSDAASTAVALWVAFTHVHDSAPVSPLLAALSPTHRCGKSTLLAVIRRLVPRPLPSSNITEAALFRVIEKIRPTLLIDEADSFLEAREGLRGILNSGHTPDLAYVLRTVGDGAESDVRSFSTWAPKVVAMIGNPPVTLLDRSIVVRLERKRPSEAVEPLEADDDRYEDLRRKLARFAEDFPVAAAGRPEVPVPRLNDRAQDNWRPLLSVAETIGGGWPALASTAASILSAAEDEDGEEGTLLLADLYELFHALAFENALAIKTDTILSVLHGREDRPWRERGWKREPLTPTGLARLLKPFGVRPTTVNLGGERAKGYRREQLVDAWSRYLPPPPEGGCHE
jgi:Protein of unknown function (DUF3631)/Domain of unknown function (DUF3854)